MAAHILPSQPQYTKSLLTTTGTTYSYISIPPSHSEKPTLLFLHGFPSSSHDWRHQITHFAAAPLGWGVIAPDLLGYGATDRPADLAAYAGKKMSQEIVEILQAEGYGASASSSSGRHVHGVAHDWGTFLLGRLLNWYPGVCKSASFLSVGYSPPGQRLDVDAVNEWARKTAGREVIGYWKFFERLDAGKIVEDHFDSFYSLVYAKDPNTWKEYLSPLGALEAFLKADKIVEVADFVTQEDKKIYLQIMPPSTLNPCMNWYRSAIAGSLNFSDETIPPGDSSTSPFAPKVSVPLDPKVNIPVLFIETALDPLSGGTRTIQTMSQLVSDLRIETFQAGHWVMLEMKEEVNALLKEFVEEKEGK